MHNADMQAFTSNRKGFPDNTSLKSYNTPDPFNKMPAHFSGDLSNMKFEQLQDKLGDFYDFDKPQQVDEEQIPQGSEPFQREHFRTIIERTYTEFYGKFKD